MNYRDGLSILGYGCMRYTRKGGGIDQEKAEQEMKLAVERGVNYFDTAYIYPGCEVCLGKFLSRYGYRDQVNIATKLPHYLIKKEQDLDRYFDQQLERLQTDHVDYYLIHMLNDPSSFRRLKQLGLEEWISKRKQEGSISRIGFSFHGNTEPFMEILDAYSWDFCQIQYNYMDENSQAGIRGLKYAAQKKIPVIVMEPLRGGRLVQGLPEQAKQIIGEAGQKWSAAEWGLRWIYNHPEVTVVLSGMNDAAQVEENCKIASEADAEGMAQADLEVIEQIREVLQQSVKVPCTGCGYCMPCPQGVDIPACFTAYNIRTAEGYPKALSEYLKRTTVKSERSNASRCVGCGKCEQHCPQSIKIREELRAAVHTLEGPVYQAAAFFIRHFGHFTPRGE